MAAKKILSAERRFLTVKDVDVYRVDPYTAVKGNVFTLPLGSVIILDSRCRNLAGGTISVMADSLVYIVFHPEDPSKNNSLAETAEPIQVTTFMPPAANKRSTSKRRS